MDNFGYEERKDFNNITLKEIEQANENGIDYRNIYNRVHNLDWTIDEAISKKVRAKKNNNKSIFSEEILQKMKEIGISKQGLYNRLNRGMTIDEALEVPNKHRRYWRNIGIVKEILRNK